MEPKKYVRYDLRPKSGLFFNIGLALSTLFVITAFEWRFHDGGGFADFSLDKMPFDQLMEIPPTVHIPPPVVPIKQPRVIEVPDKEKIPEMELDFDTEITVDAVIEDIVYVDEPTVEVTPEIVEFPDVFAEPLDGFANYYKTILKNLKYPRQAERVGIQGTVYVQFLVDKDGSVTDVEIIKGIGAGCDEEAMRVVREGPKWKPGRHRALPVKSRMRMPIKFVIP